MCDFNTQTDWKEPNQKSHSESLGIFTVCSVGCLESEQVILIQNKWLFWLFWINCSDCKQLLLTQEYHFAK